MLIVIFGFYDHFYIRFTSFHHYDNDQKKKKKKIIAEFGFLGQKKNWIFSMQLKSNPITDPVPATLTTHLHVFRAWIPNLNQNIQVKTKFEIKINANQFFPGY